VLAIRLLFLKYQEQVRAASTVAPAIRTVKKEEGRSEMSDLIDVPDAGKLSIASDKDLRPRKFPGQVFAKAER